KEPDNPVSIFSVVADGGRLRPDHFHIYHGAPSVLKVLAKDKDYPFEVTGSGLRMTLRKGAVTEVPLGSLGLEASAFDCGPGCGGTIFVDRDLDDYCED